MSLQTQLLEWFDKNQRPLPWRLHYRPYEVWISEIMLQQTQMNTALPYYRRWMELFPDIRTLAQSDTKKVLKAWEGLGYYSRARNLHHTARHIFEKYSGVFPDDFDAIRGLKGVGRYTAGAIASIAFNQNRPIVDGNILRVLSRVYAISLPIDVEKNKDIFWSLEEKLIPKNKARFFNQALMELGALVCGSENPSCPICPIRAHCKASQKGRAQDYPVRSKKIKNVKITAAALVLKKKDRYLVRLRPIGGVMGGLWEFPEWKLSRHKPLSNNVVGNKIKKILKQEFTINDDKLNYMGSIKRNYTYFFETLHVFFYILPVPIWQKFSLSNTKLAGGTKPGAHPARSDRSPGGAELHEDGMGWRSDRTRSFKYQWLQTKDFSKYPFSSAHAKIIKLIQEKTK